MSGVLVGFFSDFCVGGRKFVFLLITLKSQLKIFEVMLVLNHLRSLSTQSAGITNSKSLYKFLLRRCELLPTEDTIKFYKHTVRQGFIQHLDESEPERIQEIIQQSVSDSDWVLKKFKVENTEIGVKKKTESSE